MCTLFRKSHFQRAEGKVGGVWPNDNMYYFSVLFTFFLNAVMSLSLRNIWISHCHIIYWQFYVMILSCTEVKVHKTLGILSLSTLNYKVTSLPNSLLMSLPIFVIFLFTLVKQKLRRYIQNQKLLIFFHLRNYVL